MSAQTAPQGSETEARELLRGLEECTAVLIQQEVIDLPSRYTFFFKEMKQKLS